MKEYRQRLWADYVKPRQSFLGVGGYNQQSMAASVPITGGAHLPGSPAETRSQLNPWWAELGWLYGAKKFYFHQLSSMQLGGRAAKEVIVLVLLTW